MNSSRIFKTINFSSNKACQIESAELNKHTMEFGKEDEGLVFFLYTMKKIKKTAIKAKATTTMMMM